MNNTSPEHFYEPMLLKPAVRLPQGPDWAYEAKLDGHRTIAAVGQTAALYTRSGSDCTAKYPGVIQELPAAISGHRGVLDSEIVGYDEAGNHSFGELRRRRPRAVCYVFDLLQLDGQEIVDAPFADRRKMLSEVFVAQPWVKLSRTFEARDLVVDSARSLGFEGVVAKRLSAPYQAGKRTNDQLKLRFPEYDTGFSRH